MDVLNKFAHPIARVLLGLLFLVSGYGKFQMGAEAFGGFIASQAPALAFLAWPVIVFEILAGLALIIGFQTRLVALAVAIFCVFTGIMYHGVADMTGLLKNIALAGGYLMLFVSGAGAYALDNRKS